MRFIKRFRKTVAQRRLVPDKEQEKAALRLDAVSQALLSGRSGCLFPRKKPQRGFYLWGAVGRGKSMLMDMFYDTAPISPKRRVHFNAFMGEVHAALHEEREKGGVRDPIVKVARRIARGAALLCFDEFQVTDVADAMILGRLFEQLFAQGSVIAATSNTEPKRLYEGGLNRQLFLPFIALIETHMEVIGLDGDTDHRLDGEDDGKAYFTPLNAETRAAMDKAWDAMKAGEPEKPASLYVLGRTLPIPRSAGKAARLGFAELCAAALGAADYLALARAYRALMIEAIPVMTPDMHNEARRFTLLIDTLYDEVVELVCSAEAHAPDLYPEGEGAEAFKRTVSRLIEMQGAAWRARAKER
jgi:cell division protein ZapE